MRGGVKTQLKRKPEKTKKLKANDTKMSLGRTLLTLYHSVVRKVTERPVVFLPHPLMRRSMSTVFPGLCREPSPKGKT
jgi:hypothetical protein